MNVERHGGKTHAAAATHRIGPARWASLSLLSPLELASASDFSRKKLLTDRLFHLNQDKAILTAKITRLNRQLSASSAPSTGTRWSSFISVEQLRVVCDVLLGEMMKRNQQSQKTERELQQLAGENKELVELRGSSAKH